MVYYSSAEEVTSYFSSASDFVNSSVCPHYKKRLELSTPNLVHVYSIP